MAGLKSISLDIQGARDLALINSSNDSVWLIVSLRWYDLASWLWYFLTPADRRAKVKLTLKDEGTVSCFAIRVASRHARVKGFS